MSTRLHHGYRLRAGVSPFAFIATARAALDPVRDQLDATLVMRWYTGLLDAAVATGRPAPTFLDALLAYDQVQGKLPQTSRLRDPHRVQLTFGHDPVSDRIGVLLFADQDELTAAFAALEDVEPYPYWDNWDQPADLSDTEWEQRGAFWQRVLPGVRPPAEAMLAWTLRADGAALDHVLCEDQRTQLPAYTPPLDERTRGVVQDVLEQVTPEHGRPRISPQTWATPAGQQALAAAVPLCVPIDDDLLIGHRAIDPDTFTDARTVLRTAVAAFATQLTAAPSPAPSSPRPASTDLPA